MKRPKKNNNIVIPAHLREKARSCIKAWLDENDLKPDHVYTTKGGRLSERTVRRILKGEKCKSIIDWVNQINTIFKRLHKVATENIKPAPRNWRQFFGEDFPLPSAQHEAALYNKAEVQSDELTSVAEPLIIWLLKEVRIASDQRNVWKASSLLNQVCYILELIGDCERASVNLAELARLNNHTGDFHFAADAFLRCGQAQLHAGLVRDALGSFEAGLKVIQDHKGRTPPYRVRLRLVSYRAIAMLELDDPAEARRILLKEALPLAESECSPPAIASVHNRLAIVSLKLQEPKDAMEHVLAALECRLARDMRSEVARSLLTVARVHVDCNELEQAAFVGELSLSLQQALNDYEALPQTHYLLGTVYSGLHDRHSNRESQKLTIAVTAELFSIAKERMLLGEVTKQAGFQKLDLYSSSCRGRAISCFRSCWHLERTADTKKYPDAIERAQRLLDTRSEAGK